MKCVEVLTILLLGFFLTFATFPNEFKHCDKTDENIDKCMSDAITDAVKKLTEPKYGFPGLEPFIVGHFPIYSSYYSGLVLPGKFFDYEIHGMTKTNLTTEAKMRFSSCERTLLKTGYDGSSCDRLELLLSFSKLEHKFRCKFDGDLMKRSVRGEGSGSAISRNTRIRVILQFHGKPYYNDIEILPFPEIGTRDEVEYNFDSFEGDISAEELAQWLRECECSREFFHLTTDDVVINTLIDELKEGLLNFFSKVSVDELW